MKLTCILLFFAILQLRATTYAQKINLRVTNAPLRDVFFEIQRQSGYDILYASDLINRAKPVTLSASQASIEDVLQQCLEGQGLTFQINQKTVSIRPSSGPMLNFFQDIVVTGLVTDTLGGSIPAVSVREKGKQQGGAMTDGNGHFRLTVTNKQTTLVFSSIGYDPTEVVLSGQSNVTVVLKENNAALSEVVVVGYGVQKKVNLTGSVASIPAKEIAGQPVSNLTNVIAGRLPGVIATNPNGRPGSGSTLSIRGLSTLNDNTPLVVVDGVIRSDGFSAIDPNDVESISVLKDAAAAAVYGARAANGVFLITTKRGKTNKPSITYSAYAGLQSPTFYPKLLNASQYAEVRNQALLNQGYDPANPAQSSLFFGDTQIDQFRNGVNTVNWYDEAFKKESMQTQHNVSVDGGSEAIRYFSSVGYLDQDGMFDNINYKRYNFRANVDATINKNLTLGLNLEGRQENNNSPGFDADDIFYALIRNRPTTPAYTPSGLPYNTSSEHPVEMIRSSGYDRATSDIFLGTLTFDYKLPFLTEGLSLKGLASVYREHLSDKKFFTPYSMYDEDPNGNVTGIKQVGGQTSLAQQANRRSNYTLNLSLNYTKSFGKHDVGGLLLYEQYESVGDSLNVMRQDFVSNIKDQLFASGPANQTMNGFDYVNDARRSAVGRVNYAYDSKYLFEASFRYDGSFRFAPGHRYGFFPAVSAGWRISEEPFFKNAPSLDFIESLKLRGSHGTIGNDRVNAFQYADMYTISTNTGPVVNGTAVPNISYGVYPNPNITWETQNNTNIGLDADFLKGMFGFELDYFFRTTSDILWQRQRSIPATFGRALSNENYAQMKSKGLETTLTHRKSWDNFSYNLRFTASYATNKVTNIDDPANALDYQIQKGRSYGFQTGYRTSGIFQSQEEADEWYGGYQFGQKSMSGDIRYADVNGDGQISTIDQSILSYYNQTPRIMYGLSAGFTWKNFDLNFLIQGASQRSVMLTGTGRIMFNDGGSSNTFAYLLDAWSPQNPNAAYPQAWIDQRSVNNRDSELWLKKAGYARLKSIDVGYNFRSERLKKIGIQRLKVFVSGFNLLTISQLKEFDPEVENANGNYYPQQSSVNLGVNLTL